MATLSLNADPTAMFALRGGAVVSMRSWLDGHWALLFSHPGDFARAIVDLDGWLETARQRFAEAEVRPLAVARRGQPPDDGWVTRIFGDPRIVILREANGGAGGSSDCGPLDRGALRLHEEIAGTGDRFVLIVAPDLRPHRTFVYADVEDLPSPLDLITRVETARLASNGPLRTPSAVLAMR